MNDHWTLNQEASEHVKIKKKGLGSWHLSITSLIYYSPLSMEIIFLLIMHTYLNMFRCWKCTHNMSKCCLKPKPFESNLRRCDPLAQTASAECSNRSFFSYITIISFHAWGKWDCLISNYQKKKKKALGLAQWYIPFIPVLSRQRQVDLLRFRTARSTWSVPGLLGLQRNPVSKRTALQKFFF